MKNFKKRLLALVVSLCTIASMLPANVAQAYTYGAVPQGQIPLPLSYVDSNTKVHMRGTTIAFVAESVLVDTSEFEGNMYEAYNEFILKLGDDTTPTRAAGHSWNIDLNCDETTVYVVDTITTDEMKTRYFGGDSEHAVLVSLDGQPDLEAFIGCIMDSPDMNDNEGTGFIPEEYLTDDSQSEMTMIKQAVSTAANMGVKLNIKVYKITEEGGKIKVGVDGTKDGTDIVKDSSKDEFSYDWSEREKFHPFTILVPIIVPTFADENGNWLKNISVSLKIEDSKGNTCLVDNAQYLATLAYSACTSQQLQNGLYANMFGERASGWTALQKIDWNSFAQPIDGLPDGYYSKAGVSPVDGTSFGTGKRLFSNYMPEIASALVASMYGAYSKSPTAGTIARTLISLMADRTAEADKNGVKTVTSKRSLSFNDFAIVCASLSGSGHFSSNSGVLNDINTILEYYHTQRGKLVYIEGKDRGKQVKQYEYVVRRGDNGFVDAVLNSALWVASLGDGTAKGIFCTSPKTSSLHNISNILRAKTFCMGKPSSVTEINDTSDLEIIFHNAAPVWLGHRFPLYGTLAANQSQSKIYALPYDITNSSNQDGELYLVKHLADDMTNGFRHLMAGKYQLSAVNGLSDETLKVDIEKTKTGYKFTVAEVGMYADTIVLSLEDSSDEFYETVRDLLEDSKNFGDTVTGENVKDVTSDDKSKSISILAETKIRGISVSFEVPTELVTEDIIINSSLKIPAVDCYVDKLDSSNLKTISAEEIKKAIEVKLRTTDEKDLPEEVTSEVNEDKEIIVTTIAADAPPVVIIPDIDDDEVKIQAGGTLDIYEGLSIYIYPEFTEKPSSIKDSDSFTVTCPDGTKVTGSGYSSLNDKLKDSCKYLLETYDVEFEEGEASAKLEDIKWDLVMGSYKCTMTAKVVVHQWDKKLSLALTNPAADTVSVPSQIEITGTTKIARGADDKEGTAITYGKYKAVHTLETDTYLRNPVLDTNKVYIVPEATNSSATLTYEEGREKYSDVNIELTYGGTLNATGEKWTLKDVVDVYTFENSSGEYRKAFSFEGETFVNIGDSVRIPARFDKGEADPGELVLITVESFNPADYGLTVDPESPLSIGTDNPNVIMESTVTTLSNGKEVTAELTVDIEFTEEGEYLIGDFYVSDGEITVGLTGDITNIKNPYGLCKVPRERSAMNPITMTIGNGGIEYADDGTPGRETIILQTIKFDKTDEFTDWSSLVNTEQKIELIIKLTDTISGGKGSISDVKHSFGSKVTVDVSEDNRTITLKATGKNMVAALSGKPAIEVLLHVERVANRPAVLEASVRADGELKYKYTTTKDTIYVTPLDASYNEDGEDGPNTIKPEPIPVYCEEWMLSTTTNRPVAVITATLPSSNDWQWDAQSGIPNTETLSATVGADLFKIGLGMRTHGIGIPLTADNPLADDSDDNKNALNENATIFRTITFNVKATKYWGTDNPPCSLSCPGNHPISEGGTTGDGGQLVEKSIGADAGPGSSDLKTATFSCPGAPEWKCPKCSFVRAEHPAHSRTLTAKADNPLCSFHKNGCPGHGTDEDGNPNDCTCKCSCVSNVHGEDSDRCDSRWDHDCTWTCTYNCSTGVATVKGGYGASVELTPVDNAYKQLKNSGTVTVKQEEESVTGSHTNNTLIDDGYTVGLGCVCDKKTNCIHPGETSRSYQLIETVDAVAWNSIENFYVNLLEGATIDVADGVFVTGTAGQTVLSSGAEFSIWRADDRAVRDICDDGDLNTPGRGDALVGTGRIYFTEFNNPTYAVPLGSTAITPEHASKLNVVVDMTIVADSQIGDQDDVLKVDAYPSTVSNRGSQLEHFQEVTSSSTAYKSKQGDWLTVDQADNLTAQAANAWLNANKAKIYKCNIVSDAMTIKYGALNQNVIGFLASFGQPINLCNAPFGKGQETVYRNHAAGYGSLMEMGNAAMYKGKITDLVGGEGIFRNGYTGSYSPADDSAGMYLAKGEQSSPGSLVDQLSSANIDAWNGYGSTYFNRKSTIVTNPYAASLDNYLGLHNGHALIEGGPVEITLKDDFYGKAVDTVTGDTKLVMYMDGVKLKEVEGVALLPMDTGDIRIKEETQLSFLGLHLKDTAVNSVVYDGLLISCNYTNMIKYIQDPDTSTFIENGAVSSKEPCYASMEEDDTRRINSFIIHNPLAVSSTLVCNNYGDSTIYSVNESMEDDRRAFMGVNNRDKSDYIVIGNTFILWASNFIKDGNVTEDFNHGLSAKDWGTGVASDTMTGITSEGNHGFGNSLNTSTWLGHNTVEFSFPVSYKHVNGSYIRAEANVEIDLRNVAIAGKEGISLKPDDSYATATGNMFGTPYEFTVELSAREMDGASYVVRAYAKGIPTGTSPYSKGDNATSRTSLVAYNSVYDTGMVDIVGRIGDVTITDTQDYRYSTLFWEPLNEWLIPDVIKMASLNSSYTLRPTYNILMQTTSPVIGSIGQDALSKVGLTSNRIDLPLSGNINNITEFKKTNLGLGYAVYASLSTIGSYTGKNSGSTFPTTFLEEGVVEDTRYNYVEVIPIYALYDKDENKFYDIDMYAGSGTDYVQFYTSTGFSANYTNALYVEVNDDMEQNRYCISDFAKNYSLCFNDNTKSAFTEKTYVGTAGRLVLDESANMVIGTREINCTPRSYDLSTGVFTFDNHIATYGATTDGKQDYADYAVNQRRWMFNLGLPSSTIVTYPNISGTPTAILNSNKALTTDHPNSIIVCFARLVAVGDVNTLEYDFVRANGGSTINLDGISVDYLDMPVYINDTVSYNLMRTYTPLFVSDVSRTSTQDLGMEGTH